MRKIFTAAMIVFAASVQAQKTPVKKTTAVTKAPTGIFKTPLDSFSYAAGLSVAESMRQAGVDRINSALFARAMNDVFTGGKALLTKEQGNNSLQKFSQEFADKKSKLQKAEGVNFLAKNAKKPGVIVLPSGLQYEVIKAGDPNSLKPLAIDTVVVNYIGTLVNGTEFDNSYKRGEPARFPLNRVISGWTEVLQLMPKGSHWKVYIPSELGYAANPPQGAPIPPYSALIFDITLEDISRSSAASK